PPVHRHKVQSDTLARRSTSLPRRTRPRYLSSPVYCTALSRQIDHARIDAFGGQPAEHGVNPLGRQLRAAVEPPSHHGQEGTNDVMDDKLSRNRATGILAGTCAELVAHQVRKNLADSTKGDGAAAIAN